MVDIVLVAERVSRALTVCDCDDEDATQKDLRKKLCQRQEILFDQLNGNNMFAISINYAKCVGIIGDILFLKNDFTSALSSHEEAYQVFRTNCGDYNIDTIRAAFSAGKCLHALGNHHGALKFYSIFTNSVLLDSSSGTGNQNLTEETILMMHKIAWAFHQERAHQHARRFYEVALRSAKTALGENNQILVRILNQYGNLMVECGQQINALKCYERSFQIEEFLRRQQHQPYANSASILDSLTTLSNILEVYKSMGHLEKYLTCSRELLRFLRSPNVNSSMLPSTAHGKATSILWSMVSVLKKADRPNQSLKTLIELLYLYRQKYGQDHHYVAAILNDIGSIQGQCGQTQLAIQNFKESLRIRILLKDPDECNVVTVLYNIACVHDLNGNIPESLEYLQQLVEHELLKRRLIGRGQIKSSLSTVTLITALEKMAEIYQDDLNDLDEALACVKKGISVIIKEQDDHSSTNVPYYDPRSRFLCKAGNIYLKLCDLETAMFYFSEAMRVNIAGYLPFYANIVHYNFVHMVGNKASAPAA